MSARAARGVLVALLALAAPAALAQLSPGPLSRPHASLEGVTNCLECHAPGQGVAPARCLDCHTALAGRIAAGAGLHARPEFRDCRSCHVEHHGRDFDLVFWGDGGMASFDHRRTGWPLLGAHRQAACRECHRPALLATPAARLAAGGANPQRTFLGLSPTCLSCHRDEHRGQLGAARCLACHTMESFAAAPRFDHAETGFPLVGRHTQVACASCHPARQDPRKAGGDASFLQLTGIAHDTCASCHRDPHQGRFGAACATCHQPAGWERVAAGAFDHSRTDFPLVGRHAAVACASCHGGGGGGAMDFTLAHGSCADCHRDPHQGRLGARCADCHDPRGWQRGDRAGFDHDRTRYPLVGAHRQVACRSCHPPGVPAAAAEFARCTDCHRDAHFGQLAASPGGVECARCHTVQGFSPSTFTIAAHEPAFPLAGAHRAVACIDCHREVPAAEVPGARGAPRGARTVQLAFAATSCPTCHGDPHRGEAERFTGAQGCRTCHDVHGWGEITFDHARTGFPLRGAHARAACASCHRVPADGAPARAAPGGAARPASPGATRVALAGLSPACASCHRDPHGSQFARRGVQPSCTSCHAEEAWSRVTFDHDRQTGFPLTGAHRTVPCGSCHRPIAPGRGASVQTTELPRTCEGCHGTGGGR